MISGMPQRPWANEPPKAMMQKEKRKPKQDANSFAHQRSLLKRMNQINDKESIHNRWKEKALSLWLAGPL